MGTVKTHYRRQSWFSNRFDIAKEQGIELDKNLMLADFCLETSTSLRTAKDFLKVFEMIHKIKIVNGLIKVL